MSAYLLRHLPADLWASAKARAAQEGYSLRAVILALLRYYVAHGLPPAKKVKP